MGASSSWKGTPTRRCDPKKVHQPVQWCNSGWGWWQWGWAGHCVIGYGCGRRQASYIGREYVRTQWSQTSWNRTSGPKSMLTWLCCYRLFRKAPAIMTWCLSLKMVSRWTIKQKRLPVLLNGGSHLTSSSPELLSMTSVQVWCQICSPTNMR